MEQRSYILLTHQVYLGEYSNPKVETPEPAFVGENLHDHDNNHQI